MMADMFGTMMRGLGLSPEKIMQTAEVVTGGIDRIAAALESQGAQLTAIREMQLAMAAHMGLYVAALDPAQAALAAEETAKALEPFGGATPLEGAVVPLLRAFK